MGKHKRKSNESGVALILVIFIVSLATILVVNITHSSFLSSRSLGLMKNQLQAEYILKSLVSLSQQLLTIDTDPSSDSSLEPWGIFKDGMELPLEMFGISLPNASVMLEIYPENAKIPLTHVVEKFDGGSTVEQKRAWLVAYQKLFEELGFDLELLEPDESGLFPGRVFESRELVGNLNDYQDRDTDPIQDLETGINGYESSSGELRAKNEPIKNAGELAMVPGFSAGRRQRLAPYVRFSTASGDRQVNVNVASAAVLRAISNDLGNAHGEIQNEIASTGKGLPGQGALLALPSLSGLDTKNLSSMLTYTSRVFQVIGKVSYGPKNYFVRAIVEKQGSGVPKITQIEFF